MKKQAMVEQPSIERTDGTGTVEKLDMKLLGTRTHPAWKNSNWWKSIYGDDFLLGSNDNQDGDGGVGQIKKK